MSMPTWLNDVQVLPTNENGVFATSTDPSSSFMSTPTAAPLNFNQLHNPQLQQRLQNGTVRNSSPAFNNPVYPTQPLVPSKRARPAEDSLGASPRQISGPLPTSRSQTPSQPPYPGFQVAVNGAQPFQTPTSYQHSQPASGPTSLSPIVKNQPFNPPTGQQRVQTASPSPFSPTVPTFSSQASPSQSEHGSRVNTPQNGGQGYTQGIPFGSGPSQSFGSPNGPNHGNPSAAQYPQNAQTLQQQQRLHEMRIRQMQATNFAQHRVPAGVMSSTPSSSGSMANYPMGFARPQQVQPFARQINSEQFIRGLAQWMQQRRLPFNPHLTVLSRPVPLAQLFGLVIKHGGSKKVTAMSQWTEVARYLKIPQTQWAVAAQEIQLYWHNNVLAYETWWLQSQRQRAAMSEQMRTTLTGSNPTSSNAHGQYSPSRPEDSHLQAAQAQQQVTNGQLLTQAEYQAKYQAQTPIRQMTPHQHDSVPPSQNGYINNHKLQAPNGQPTLDRLSQAGSNVTQLPSVSHINKDTPDSKTNVNPNNPSPVKDTRRTVTVRQVSLGPEFKPMIRTLEGNDPTFKVPNIEVTHGGVEVSIYKDISSKQLDARSFVPQIQELGVVDIRALTMALRSGLSIEVRLALNKLALIAQHSKPLCLADCEDLVEVLIECANNHVDLLAENAAEVSDVMLITSYEEIARGCRAEVKSLQEVHSMGTLNYELDQSVERLICITTILRNLSFWEINHNVLIEPHVIKFITTVIQYLGTRNMLLRSYGSTLDFAKDIVIYLSNVAEAVDLPGKEEAFCILNFLLSFAPSPTPSSGSDEDISFAPYNPLIHSYYPAAINSLAKLLARDEPNRAYYRAIFHADNTSIPSYDLLIRTFGLAIASIPEYGKVSTIPTVEARKPFLAQGLLAAEILVGLIPSSERGLARSWLSSQDGFALSLMKVVFLLGQRMEPAQRHPITGRIPESDPLGYGMIIFRGLSIIRKLVEKAKDVDGSLNELPTGIWLQRESLLYSLLLRSNVDENVVRQLCVYSSLEK